MAYGKRRTSAHRVSPWTRGYERGLDDTGKHDVDFRRKGSAKPRALILVPITGVE
jgi:hypothetical protein